MQDLNTIVSKFVLFEKESKLIGIFKNIIDVLESNRRDHEQVKLKLLKLLSEKINSLDLDFYKFLNSYPIFLISDLNKI